METKKHMYNFLLGTIALSLFVAFSTDTSFAQKKLTPDLSPKILEPRKIGDKLEFSNSQGKGLPKLLGGSPVQVGNLGGINIDSLGTLSRVDGGFGDKIWDGFGRSQVDSLLSNLPTRTTSFAMQNLMRRLLLSRADPPIGSGSSSLLSLRAKLLLAMGNINDVQELVALIPDSKRHNSVNKIEADSRFLVHDNARACKIAATQVSDTMDQYWQQALIFCQMLAGESEKAALGISLMKELGYDIPLISALVDSIVGNEKIVVPTFSNSTPLHFALARIAEVDLPEDVIFNNNPSILRAIAISPNAEVHLRLDAAERANALGALNIDTLRQVYDGAEFSSDQRQQPLTLSAQMEGALGRALLYQTVSMQEISMVKAETIMKAFQLARDQGRYLPVVRAFEISLDRVQPSSDLLWFAPEAIRAYFTLHNLNGLRKWLSILRASALFHQESNNLLNRVAPLGHIIGLRESNKELGDILSAWWKAVAMEPKATHKATVMFALFEALGAEIPASLWTGFVPTTEFSLQSMPDSSLKFRLMAALKGLQRKDRDRKVDSQTNISSDDRGIGAVLVICLLLLGEGGPGKATPGVLHQVISALVSLDLEVEARAIALEAAIELGI